MPDEKRPLKIFLCHAHSDKDAVFALHDRLSKDGVDVWLDKKSLIPGQDWEYEIRKAVRESDVVVVCLSKQFNQAGFRQKEVRIALDTAMEQPEGEIFIIPARLEECDTLESLRKWHWVDLFEPDGYDYLMRALRLRANKIGAVLQNKAGWLPKIASQPKSDKIRSIKSSANEKKPDSVQQTSPLPKAPEKQPRKLKPEYIVAIIGAAATIIAGIFGSPWIEKMLAPTAVPMPLVMTVTLTAAPTPVLPSATITNGAKSPTATFPVLPPSETPQSSLTPTEVFVSNPTITNSTTPTQNLNSETGQLAFFQIDDKNKCQIVFDKNSGRDFLPCPEYPKPDIDVIEPHWSADGQYVAIRYARTYKDWIYITSVKQKSTSMVVNDSQERFGKIFWLDDNSRLFFDSDVNGVFTLWAFNSNAMETSIILSIPSGLGPYSISPDGEKVVFYSWPSNQGNLYIKDTGKAGNIKSSQRLTNFKKNEYSKDIGWIDSGTIFFSMGDDNIYIMPLSDNSIRKIGNGTLPMLSPNGKRLAFYSDRLSIFDFVQNQFMSILANNSVTVAYTNAFWSPNSQYIALTYENQIMIYSLDDDKFVTIPGHFNFPQFNSPRDLVWSFDNNQIAFTAEQDNTSYVYVVARDGSSITKIIGGNRAFSPAWILP